MTAADLQDLARRQLADYDARTPGTMFADRSEPLTIEEAYRLQIETAGLRRLRGEAIAGYKIGCVSQVIQRQLGVTQPVFGHLFASEVRPSGAVLPNEEFDHLGIEGEFALTLQEDILNPSALRDDPLRFVKEIFPVIELHNYVFRGPKPVAAELIANNAVNAGIVVPKERGAASGRAALEISVSLNGQQQGAASVDPLATLDQLVERLRAYGIHPRKGEILLTGSPLPLYPVEPGDHILVSCLRIATVTATVSASSNRGAAS